METEGRFRAGTNQLQMRVAANVCPGKEICHEGRRWIIREYFPGIGSSISFLYVSILYHSIPENVKQIVKSL